MTVSADPGGRFAEIYDAYSGLILAYASARTDDPADAADIVADVFTVAWRRIKDMPDGVEARPCCTAWPGSHWPPITAGVDDDNASTIESPRRSFASSNRWRSTKGPTRARSRRLSEG